MPSDPEPIRTRDPAIRTLNQDLSQASDPQIMRVVATVDAMRSRGVADQLVAPLRRRLLVLRPPRLLRFARLLFHPLNPLIAPPARWRPGHHTIPRSALAPMADHIRQTMGTAAFPFCASIAGHTDAETDLIVALGKTLWPAAAKILAAAEVPSAWGTTELGQPAYRPLADLIAALLEQASALDDICGETANGLLPPRAKSLATILTDVATTNRAALPMMIVLLLTRLPQAAAILTEIQASAHAAAVREAMTTAADHLFRQLQEQDGTEVRIAAGSLVDAGAEAKGIMTLLQSLGSTAAGPRRREKLNALRARLDAACKSRFTEGLRDEVLTPLQQRHAPPDAATVTAIETAARGLRVLEAEARAIGGAATYDRLLTNAAAQIDTDPMRAILSLADRMRLVEILAGPDAAFLLLKNTK
jgi:hypothetical protein